MSLEQELLITPVFSEVRVAHSLDFCVVFCRSFFVLAFLLYYSYCIVCSSIYVSDYPFGIFKLFFYLTPFFTLFEQFIIIQHNDLLKKNFRSSTKWTSSSFHWKLTSLHDTGIAEKLLSWHSGIITHSPKYKYDTVELLQSDTWVFRHPVTSDKNLWSQSISVN